MKYIINYSNDTAFNIALEEYAFKHLLDEDQIFLLWINKPSIISLVVTKIPSKKSTVTMFGSMGLKWFAESVVVGLFITI